MMGDARSCPPIALRLDTRAAVWFGVAASDDGLVATSTGTTREEALRFLKSSLPQGSPLSFAPGSGFPFESTIDLLATLEAGGEALPEFTLSRAWISESSAKVYRLAAAIPRGYACSYGRIARAAGVIAREVGGLMARNPLYPLVPCHRVVGSDYGLVGYRGATEGPDLDDKLERLRAEARGFEDELRVGGADGILVFPVERVIARAGRRARGDEGQLALW